MKDLNIVFPMSNLIMLTYELLTMKKREIMISAFCII